MITLFFIAVVVVGGIAAILYLFLAKESWTFALAAISMVCFVVALFLAPPVIQGRIYSELSKDVSLTEVPVKGEKKFRAQYEITYKNGGLEAITLVSQTTAPLTPSPEEKKESAGK